MTIEKLTRVMARVRARNPGAQKITRQELVRAIMIECGTCPQTYYNNKAALTTLGWIRKKRRKFYLTGLDLTGDFE